MIRISQIKISIDDPIEKVKDIALKVLRLEEADIKDFRIYKQSIDARRRGKLELVHTVDLTVDNEEAILSRNIPNITKTPQVDYIMPTEGTTPMKHRPVVIGFGPAGMYAALLLAQKGYRPIVLERGEAVEERVKAIDKFWSVGELSPNSNVQFGEGGAGTFSDGKLTTRVKDLRGRKVLEELVAAGAPEDILYMAHPHVGTDLLRGIVKNMREEIIRLGGEVRFNCQVKDFIIEDGKLVGLQIPGGTLETNHAVLAIGHSARDTFFKLYDRNVDMTAKPFAVGIRIEHPQFVINDAQYKEFSGHPKLGAAEYRLTHKASNGRGVYTFCMCPGGLVVPSSSEKGRLVTNGMSEHARDEANANAGLLVTVGPADFGSDHPLAGVEYQRKLEEKAFGLGGSNYVAPAQLVGDFLKGQKSKAIGSVKPSYALGVKMINLNKLFPDEILEPMREALKAFDRKLKGFAMDDAIMTAVESRSSSPVRIERSSETFQSPTASGLYPSGEGAGFAGGIVSAGIDGLKCAQTIIEEFAPPTE